MGYKEKIAYNLSILAKKKFLKKVGLLTLPHMSEKPKVRH
jgi:hypothetical protein